MSLPEQEFQAEQQRVTRVVTEIDERIDHLTEKLGAIREEVVEIRNNFWDDVTVNLDEPDDIIETYVSLKQQAEVLSERERNHRHAQNQLKKLLRLHQSPYFGRIDFTETGSDRTDSIYLGIGSLLNATDDEFLIYDWRAPVSSLYYDYPPGPAEYETPDGTVHGELELKRQYIIRDGRILSLFDTGVTIGDELLQEVLGKHSDSQMKSIVATIQREQNRIIRNTTSRLLIVQGAAGSGKTSAALQRVAYLLYRFRESLTADQIVLFSPNTMFNSYVSTVLPELGEENMQQTTFIEYLEHRLGRDFHIEDPLSQMEYVLTAMGEGDYEARIEGITFKSATSYLEMLERYVAHLGREGLVFKGIRFRGETLISSEQIRTQFYTYEPTLPIPNRMRLLTEWLLEELRAISKQELEKGWVDEEIELLDPETYLKAYQRLRKKKQFTENSFDDYEKERDQLAYMVVQEHFKKLRSGVKRLRFLNVPAVYRNLFANEELARRLHDDLPARWQEIAAKTVELVNDAYLAYEDATPYLYLKERLEGFQTNNSIRHVFVDEAQDYSPFQFAFLKRLFPRAKMTVLGYFNQAIYAHANPNSSFDWLNTLYGPEETELFVLTKSYRSTRQIVEFTKEMLRDNANIEPFNRPGSEPTVQQLPNHSELAARITDRILQLQGEGHRTIGLICKTAAESRQAYDALKGNLDLRLITQESGSFEAGIQVIPAYLAKGVEFDAVVIYNASREQYGRESERKLFYTACTRAMHELHVYFLGEKSPFLP
ncbi:RNA polymerase recycling motor HelD [Tumebacillus flagellatus]|uniref:Helicase n=1 Tax=Tumebacillus flagellatus TaxID=1157490 RepID=A0A074M5M2_9BACL|nr:RNA polymerase recycling motor HelD [Tumebacillus flagellatus]KEO81302.1 helicase [Tumebacillus flagellatus]